MAHTSSQRLPRTRTQTVTMFKLALFTLFAIAAALPNPQEYVGEWETVATRQPHQIAAADHAVVVQDPGFFWSTGTRVVNFFTRNNWWTWDRSAVYDGIFKNENIMIHVGQNLFNFVFTTLAWFTTSQIYTATGRAGWGRALTFEEAADDVRNAIREFEEKRR